MSVNTTGALNKTNATDNAFLKLFTLWNLDFQACRERELPADGNDLIRFAFDSDSKRMSTVSIPSEHSVKSTKPGYNRRLHMKGGGEKVIPACSHFLDSSGNVQPIDDAISTAIQQEVLNFTHQALRVIVMAYKDIDENEGGADHKDD